jgi:Flp pilus assembly protein TadG
VAGDEGSAAVDFVLVSLILVPLFLAILQLGLDLYVRNTLAACAQDAARYAASEDIGTRGAGAIQLAAQDRAGRCIDDSLAGRFSASISGIASTVTAPSGSTVDVVEVDVAVPMPVVGFLNLGGLHVRVSGHALQEQP